MQKQKALIIDINSGVDLLLLALLSLFRDEVTEQINYRGIQSCFVFHVSKEYRINIQRKAVLSLLVYLVTL